MRTPIWAMAALFVLILTGALEAGYRLVGKTAPGRKDTAQLGTIHAAILGLLALVLSFTYSFAANRLETRKSAVIREANAIGTAYLRADFAPEPLRGRMRSLLEAYARTRLIIYSEVRTPEGVRRTMAPSLEIQDQLWPVVRSIMEHSAGPKEALLAQAVNEVIDVHTIRLTAAFDWLPDIVIIMMLVIAGLAMLITGYAAAISGAMSRWPRMAFAVLLAFLMFVIVDMDRALTGFVQVSQKSLEELIVSMQKESPPPPPIEPNGP